MGEPESAIIVTGAASGIGLAVSQRLVADGYVVFGLDRDADGLKQVESALEERFKPIVCDLGHEDMIEEACDAVKGSDFDICGLVNNAVFAPLMPLSDLSQAKFDQIMHVTLLAPMLLVRNLAPLLAQSNGAVVNMGSIATRTQLKNHFLYSAAKLALEKFTRDSIVECPGVRFNCVLPGVIDTPILAAYGDDQGHEFKQAIAKTIPAGRIGKPEDVANTIAFLLSDQAAYINGSSVIVDGGLFAVAGY